MHLENDLYGHNKLLSSCALRHASLIHFKRLQFRSAVLYRIRFCLVTLVRYGVQWAYQPYCPKLGPFPSLTWATMHSRAMIFRHFSEVSAFGPLLLDLASHCGSPLSKSESQLPSPLILALTSKFALVCSSVITTAAPAILAEIPIGDNWIWMTNAFFLACAAFQPLLGQISDLFGRRWTTLFVVATFMVGSAICGGARSEATLIAGRAVQGIGSGGILMAFGEYNVVPVHC